MPMLDNGHSGSTTSTSSDSRNSYRNFSRPRTRRQRSYSTGPLFRFHRKRPQQDEFRQNITTPEDESSKKQVLRDPFTAQRRRPLRTTDDGRLDEFQQHKNIDEEGVLNAFRRWELSEQARLKHRRPDMDAEVPIHVHRSPQVAQMRLPSHVRHIRRDKGPVFEKVEGAVLDAKPAATGPFGQEMTIPEMEAQDVREIQDDQTEDRSSQSTSVEDYSTLSSLSALSSMTSATSSSGRSLQFSSTSPDSSSATSTHLSTPSPNQRVPQRDSTQGKLPYKHIPVTYMPSPVKDGDIAYALNSQHDRPVHDVVVAPAGSYTEVSTTAIEPYREPAAAPIEARSIPLAAIQEEQAVNPHVEFDMTTDTAPTPIVKGISNKEVAGEPHHSKLSALKERIAHATHSTPSADDNPTPPPRTLLAAGTGDDKHVYELEAVSMPSQARPHSHTQQESPKETNNDEHGALSKLGLGVSKASHAIHEKVKKTVTFNTVDDVRLMTPSPQRLSLSLEEQATA
jgi:hypothetical protein